MANTRSSKKDLRRSEKRRVRNQETRTSLKTYTKKVRQAAAAGDAEGTKEKLVTAVSAIDKALQRGIIHKNAAARRKSRAAKAANAVADVVAAPAKAAKAPKTAKKGTPAKKTTKK
jgi:small subunit ribosomal protein S20